MKTFYKHLIWTLCIFMGLQSTYAQQIIPNIGEEATPKIKKWKVANIGLHIGSYFDNYSNMSQAGLESMIRGTYIPSVGLEGNKTLIKLWFFIYFYSFSLNLGHET